jgi:hypothetical protein
MAIQLTRLHTYHILVCGHLNSVGSEKKKWKFYVRKYRNFKEVRYHVYLYLWGVVMLLVVILKTHYKLVVRNLMTQTVHVGLWWTTSDENR